MKVAVYAICLNERQFVERFMSTASEADYVVVADTGSTDGTQDALRECGALVHEISIKPWRFDDARNAALALVPADTDVCVVVDLDEVLEVGWCERLKSNWTPEATRGFYWYVWSHNPDGSDGVSFMGDRVHARHGFRWVHPCHEVLVPDRTVEHHVNLGYELHHWPDDTKSRGQYLPLLELAASERPDDPRTSHYLGREYMFRAMWDDAERELLRHLTLPQSVWKPERAASMRYLARCHAARGNEAQRLFFARSAALECPEVREGWVEWAQVCHELRRWRDCLDACERAIEITVKPPVYTTEPWAWGAMPFDLAAVAAWNLGEPLRALDFGETACELAPDDERMAANLRFFREWLAERSPTD